MPTTLVAVAVEDGLRLEGVSKSYGATRALDDVSFAVASGTIHALLGGNGSGKSTLIKILAGVVQADRGRVRLAGEPRNLRAHSAAQARELRMHFVHQQSSMFPAMSVAENLSFGRGFERAFAGCISWGQVRSRARRVLDRFGIDADPDEPLSNLGPATQMMVAIARALQDEESEADSILVLDEPTASLPSHEVGFLLDTLQQCAARGCTIVYVTHRLEEVLRVADRVTVLRDGRVVVTCDRGRMSHDELVELIMGEPVRRKKRLPRSRAGASVPALRARGLGRGGAIDLDVRAGEIVGIAGMMSSGRTSLLRQLLGVVPSESATIEICGEPAAIAGPREAIAHGIAYLPEDRPRDAMFSTLTIAENLSIAALDRHGRRGWTSRASELNAAVKLMSAFHVVGAAADAPVAALSGGNQQKVMLARWLQRMPTLLLLDEPTQGVDYGARAEIHELIRSAAERGAGVLLVSSDFEELAHECDRVLVLRDGRIVAELDREIREEDLNRLAYASEAG